MMNELEEGETKPYKCKIKLYHQKEKNRIKLIYSLISIDFLNASTPFPHNYIQHALLIKVYILLESFVNEYDFLTMCKSLA